VSLIDTKYVRHPTNCTRRNINVFGLAFVIATSLFFAIIDIVLLKFLIYLSSFRKALSPRVERWIQDGVLQLQRRAYEAHKEGTWSELSREVPMTAAKELLTDLPLASLPSGNTLVVSPPPKGPKSNAAARQFRGEMSVETLGRN
jgi:hypothetical protein